MIVQNIHVYEYHLDLLQPIYVKGRHILQRQGLLLELNAEGYTGYGDIAPLEGISVESFEDARQQILKVKAFLQQEPIPVGIEKLDGAFQEWLGGLGLFPTVRFGVEMAALNLKAAKRHLILAKLLSETTHQHVPINGLLYGDQDMVVQQAKELLLAGYKGFKLKVGQNLDEDIPKVKAVNQVIREKALLHLDVNQQWSLKEGIVFGKAIGPAMVDYVEEPFQQLEDIHAFFDETLIPVALDESLLKVSFKQIKSLDPVSLMILKPSVLGGLERVWQMIQEAKQFGLETLISSIYESSVGVYTLANIAGCSFRNNAAGLDTLRHFKEDVLKEPLQIHKGQYVLNGRLIDHEALNHDRLTLLPS